jgi:hypothetical protein
MSLASPYVGNMLLIEDQTHSSSNLSFVGRPVGYVEWLYGGRTCENRNLLPL